MPSLLTLVKLMMPKERAGSCSSKKTSVPLIPLGVYGLYAELPAVRAVVPAAAPHAGGVEMHSESMAGTATSCYNCMNPKSDLGVCV